MSSSGMRLRKNPSPSRNAPDIEAVGIVSTRRQQSPRASRSRSKTPTRSTAKSSPSKKSTAASINDHAADQDQKWKKVWMRVKTTLIMIAGYLIVIYLGHWAVVGLVFLLSVQGFREIENLALQKARIQGEPVSNRLMNWYWFGCMSFFMHGQTLSNRFPASLNQYPWLKGLSADYHPFLTLLGFVFGVVCFVLLLEKGQYKAQFKQLAWTYMALFLVVLQSSFWVEVVFEGLFWIMFATSLVISNDCWAYIWGFFFGRTPLIQLSPKKTWEGFIGGGVMTVIWAVGFCYLLAQFDYIVCPKTSFFEPTYPCERHPVFVLREYTVPSQLVAAAGSLGLGAWLPASATVWMYPVQLHSLWFALFASLIAPFGGFFASGFKRAFKLKDFADTIPGHGGILDRMDCQFLMGTFTYAYLLTFIVWYPSVEFLMSQISSMPKQRQVELYNQLTSLIKK